ncbi:MAG: hypothetical protein D6755_07770 [Anaerolineae bacterium]|nr:MAG: hypothetical protein D6755_07770 [Anaerolineae bacterium]
MSTQESAPRHNPETHAHHRKETAWQIYLPVGFGVLLVVVAGVLGSMATAPTASKWADTSLIFLSALTCLPMLILLALVGGMAYGLWEANRRLPPVMFRVQQAFRDMSRIARHGSDRLAAPLIKARQTQASLRALFSREKKHS